MIVYFPFPLTPKGKRVPLGKTNCTSTVDDEGKLTSVSSGLQFNVVSEVVLLLTKLAGKNAGVVVNLNTASKQK